MASEKIVSFKVPYQSEWKGRAKNNSLTINYKSLANTFTYAFKVTEVGKLFNSSWISSLIRLDNIHPKTF